MTPLLRAVAEVSAPIGQPLYRPLLILSIFLVAIMAAAVWLLWRHPPEHEDLSTLEKFRELVRAVLTAALTAGFVVLTFEGKIDAAIYANSFGMILAFLFGTKVGKRDGHEREERPLTQESGMPTNEQAVFARPGTHLFSPITELTLRTSDPAPPLTGATLYVMLTTGDKIALKVIFATSANTLTTATPQVLALST